MSNLPLLEYTLAMYRDISLKNTLLIGAQHILGTTHDMIRLLYRQGLEPRHTYLMGKCYSTCTSVMREMREDGINVSDYSLFFDPYKSFDQQFLELSTGFLKSILSKVDLSSFEKIIIIDDGGQLLSLSQEMFKKCKDIVGVEQTTSGFEKLRNMHLHFPVINVARSPAKLIYESPMIANAIVDKIHQQITSLDNHNLKILIMGNGAIGSALSTLLKTKYEVEIYDHNEKNPKITKATLGHRLGDFDVLLGCTGNTSIPATLYQYLKKGCILISASSSDREFEAVQMRKAAEPIQNCHEDIEVNGIRLLNCGFPINFDGSRHSVPAAKIQLTRALLAAGIFQACSIKTHRAELLPLDIDAQRDILHKFFEITSLPICAIK